MSKLIDLTGQRYGRLTVLKRVGLKNSSATWLCRCDCGNEKVVAAHPLREGKIQSCGCLRLERLRAKMVKHGGTIKGKEERLYNTLKGMKRRCYSKNFKGYPQYGGRGIKVCDEWLGKNGYEKFREWAMSNGYRDDLTIDRIDVNGNYEPSNCRWVTLQEQALNRQNTRYVVYEGERRTLKSIADECGIYEEALVSRLRLGWTIEKAVSTPLKERQKNKHKEQANAERIWRIKSS